MVKAGPLGRLGRQEDGVSFVEAMLAMPIVMLMTVAMVEFGFMLTQWNQTVKALQVGARLAAVSEPLMDLTPLTTGDPTYAATDEGDPVPSAIISVSCVASTCDSAAMDRLMTGGDNVCGPVVVGTPAGICDAARFLTEDNIRITYIRSRLGYVGRPTGPVVTIKLEVINKTFDFLLLGSLLARLGPITFPPHTITITSEDLNDCQATCP